MWSNFSNKINRKERSLSPLHAIAIVLLTICAATATDFKCEMEGTTEAVLSEMKLENGKTSLICIHFVPLNIKLSFELTVDDYSMVSGRSIFNVLTDGTFGKKDVDMAVQISGSAQFSQQIPYFRVTNNKVFSVISILIHVKEGQITKIELEDLQNACPQDKLVPTILDLSLPFSTSENSIHLCSQEACSDNAEGQCDPKIFVSWIGTDAQGNAMNSNLDRITNFSTYNQQTMFESMLATQNVTGDASKDNYDSSQIPANVKNRISN